jgi:hypothetical protein
MRKWFMRLIRGRRPKATSLSHSIEKLQFRSDLAEVQLLLDFISGRPDKAFTWKAEAVKDLTNSPATVLRDAVANDRITVKELQHIAKIRFPPNKNVTENAKDAALLTIVRDKLNQLVRPASGLTIAFTLLTWKPMFSGKKGLSREWARWKLATEAYPRLYRSILWFRLSACTLFASAVLVTLITLALSDEVANGYAKLNRIQVLDQKWSAMDEVIRQAESIASAPNVLSAVNGQHPMNSNPSLDRIQDPPRPRSSKRANPKIPSPSVDSDSRTAPQHSYVDCYRRKLISAEEFTPVPKFDVALQYETCEKYDKLNDEIKAARNDIAKWRDSWNNSPYAAWEKLYAAWEKAPLAMFATTLTTTKCWALHLLDWEDSYCTAGFPLTPQRGLIVPAVLKTQVLSPIAGAESGSELPASGYEAAYTEVADTLAELSTIWLPVLYGCVGAIVAALRSTYTKISSSTLAPWDTRLMWTRVVLGMMAGACVGLFFSPTGTSVQSSMTTSMLSLSAIAFLSGYAVDGLFAMLDETIRRVFRSDTETPQSRK